MIVIDDLREPDCRYNLCATVEEQRIIASKLIVVVDADDKDDILPAAVIGLDVSTLPGVNNEL